MSAPIQSTCSTGPRTEKDAKIHGTWWRLVSPQNESPRRYCLPRMADTDMCSSVVGKGECVFGDVVSDSDVLRLLLGVLDHSLS